VFLEILEPGMLTTVQDLGRLGSQRLGIPVSGAMDPFALRAANVLVGNEPGAACLEATIIGPRIAFGGPAFVAIAGADLRPKVDGREVPCWEAILVGEGSVLEFGGSRWGARAYIAVAGGIAVEPWLGSRSTYLMAKVGGHEGRALQAGDRLPVGDGAIPLRVAAGTRVPFDLRPPYTENPVVRVIWGPHSDRFTEGGKEAFLSGSYSITQTSNRMGYRLEGPKIEHTRGPDLISCGIPLGGIQVPGVGQPIILMADHQTTGGYTMIATVIQADIPLVAQCLPGNCVHFRAVDLDEATEAIRSQRRGLDITIESKEVNIWAGYPMPTRENSGER
jgi:biotin-dependent carboxylase-like uncharacterized protein